MDYSLAALKLFCVQLKDASPTVTPSSMTLGSILFQRAWLQASKRKILKKKISSTTDESHEPLTSCRTSDCAKGMYVMVVGIYVIQTSNQPFIKVHKIVDLSSFPDREALWYLEVIEAYKMFYQPSLEE